MAAAPRPTEDPRVAIASMTAPPFPSQSSAGFTQPSRGRPSLAAPAFSSPQLGSRFGVAANKPFEYPGSISLPVRRLKFNPSHARLETSPSRSILKKRPHDRTMDNSTDLDPETTGQVEMLAPPESKKLRTRGSPRVRFHQLPGRGGPGRGGTFHRARFSPSRSASASREASPVTLHPLPLFRSNSDADAVSDHGTTVIAPPSCDEQPEIFPRPWPADAFFDFEGIPIDVNDSVFQHSAPVRPCENGTAHKTPFQVCSTCRTRAARHLVHNFPRLAKPCLMPLCRKCGEKALREHGYAVIVGSARSNRQGSSTKRRCKLGEDLWGVPSWTRTPSV
ncbi:MAG: hypothetical protein Q9190_001201 [Brigantiaea leucoxantha]